jgi:hypothetical protein
MFANRLHGYTTEDEMAVTADEMHHQIKLALDTMGKPTAKDTGDMVSSHFAENFNRQLALSKEAMSEVDERRWPRELDVRQPSMGPGKSNATFAEVRAYYGQILGVLSEGVTPIAF